MKNEDTIKAMRELLKEAIAGSNKLCLDHGEKIARLEANQLAEKDDIQEIKEMQASLLVKLDGVNDQLLIFKTQRNMVVGAICGAGTLIGVILGAGLDFVVKKLGGLSWLM